MQSEYTLTEGKPSVVLELLPALPENWKDGSVSGIRARGGLAVEMDWEDSQVKTLKITAQKGCRITLRANGIEKAIKLKKGVNAVRLD